MSEQRELTAMQELKQRLDDEFNRYGHFLNLGVRKLVTELLAKEKSQIVDAWTTGWNDRGNDDGDFSQHEDGEDYYSLTYKSMGEL